MSKILVEMITTDQNDEFVQIAFVMFHVYILCLRELRCVNAKFGVEITYN